METGAKTTSVAVRPDVCSGSRSYPDWQLLALMRPALVQAGAKVVSVATRRWLEWALQAAQHALQQLLDRPVHVDFVPPSALPADERFCFGFTFTQVGAASQTLLACDLPLSRAIATAVEVGLVGLRGSGAPSDAETGLLEYAVLVCVDDVLRRAAPAGASLAIKDFLGEREIASWAAAANLAPLAFRVSVGGQQGTLGVWLPGSLNLAGLESLDSPALGEQRTPALEVRLSLPAVLLRDEERMRLVAGDVLLLDASDLCSFATSCRLVASTQWILSQATLVSDSPSALTVRCGALDVGPDNGMLQVPAGSVLVRPFVGRTTLTLDQIRRWEPGATVDLTKDLASPVDLLAGLDPLGSGELVKAEGNLGIRLLRLAGPSTGGPA
jgi:hypothetical protein